MSIARKGKVILVLAAFLIPLIPKLTLAGNKTSKVGKLHYTSAHHRGDRTDKLDCASGEIAKFDGSKWTCAPDDNTDTLGELNCLPGEIAKFDGSVWICASDDNSGTLGQLSCSDGQIAQYDETSKEWVCAEVGGGSQPCPDGFVVLNDKVCIEYVDKGDEVTWFEANRTCIINNARLCTVGEWAAACQENKLERSDPSIEGELYEWTGDIALITGVGNSYAPTTIFEDCTSLAAGLTTGKNTATTFRCCRDR